MRRALVAGRHRMLAVRGVLLALLSRSAQLGVECFQLPAEQPHKHSQQPQPPPAAIAPPPAAAVVPSAGCSPTAAPPSIDSSKLHKIAERMCGMKGDELSIAHMCAASVGHTSRTAADSRGVGGVKPAQPAPACQCVSAAVQRADVGGAVAFSGLCAVRWLLRSGLVDRPASAVFLCRRLLAERLIRPTATDSSIAATPLSGRSFYSSPAAMYTFSAEYSTYQQPTEEDIDRLSLHTHHHSDSIAALCKHYNHKDDRRRQSDKQTQLSVAAEVTVTSGKLQLQQ